jgi:HAD superfamily hydrolase (TIGR01509 family)
MTATTLTDHGAYQRFTALVFDCDGTLADTMPAHYTAWCTTLQRYGLTFPEARFYALGGTPADRLVRMLAEEQGVAIADADAVAQEKEEVFAEHLTGIAPIDPVVALARAYRGHKPLAVATGGYRWLVQRSLTQIGVLDWFDVLVSCDDVTGHKPEPDTYLEAARRLDCAPDACCAFEDTDLGIESAERAGMTAVDVRQML